MHRGLPSCGFLLGASIPKPLLPPLPPCLSFPTCTRDPDGFCSDVGQLWEGNPAAAGTGGHPKSSLRLVPLQPEGQDPPLPRPPPQAFAQELREQILNIDPASPGTILAASPSASRWALAPAPSLLNPRSRSAPPGPGGLVGGGRGEIWGSPSSSQQLAQPGFGFASTQGFGSFTLLPLLAPCGPESRDHRGVGHGPPLVTPNPYVGVLQGCVGETVGVQGCKCEQCEQRVQGEQCVQV